jgi:signal transduction histidine kinase
VSLRLKFLILISGAVIVPIAVFTISFRLNTDVESLRSYRALLSAHHTWRSEFNGSTVDTEDLGALFAKFPLPSATEVRVFDEDANLLFCRTPELLFGSDSRYHITETIPVAFANGGAGLVVVTRPPSPFSQNEDRWYVPLTGLVFVCGMIIFIVQSINRSISNLEKATRRIAEGDLDFQLPIRGNDKLASLTRSFDSMREHLKEEYARRSRFIMGISHDLKTPLSSISGYANAIGEGYADTPDKLDRYVGIIEDKTKLLESRISMLIDYVRRDTTEWKLRLQPVALGPFFAELGMVFESEVALKKRTLVSNVHLPVGTTVPMDEDMVVRAMENLMHNALTYSPEGSEIRFSCASSDEKISVSLSNDGPGINPEDLPHIFDPFVRGSKDRKGSGLGLGLATVESVISSHGWHIAATSGSAAGPDAATVFTITIPLEIAPGADL